MGVKKTITICHLYPNEMSIYGDTGNVLVLQRRLKWRGIEAKLVRVGVGDTLPKNIDIIVAGGGQDAGQSAVQKDLLRKSKDLHDLAADGVGMLLVCGTYQLFGRRFVTETGEEIKGIGLLAIETIAGPERLIGNTVIETAYGPVVGYENHSGRTTLGDGQIAFGTVTQGAGNNGVDQTEGAMHMNIIGTYLHGPILPKNPHIADLLLSRALERKYGDGVLTELDDSLANSATQVALSRPR